MLSDLASILEGCKETFGASVAILSPPDGIDTAVAGIAPLLLKKDNSDNNNDNNNESMNDKMLVQIASISKTIGTAFAFEYFRKHNISLETPVNEVLATKTSSPFRLESAEGCPASWADEVLLYHLVSHTALRQHYVFGQVARESAADDTPPLAGCLEQLLGQVEGYEYARVHKRPDSAFGYSGAGFVLLQHILESHSKQHISALITPWLEEIGLGGDFAIPDEYGLIPSDRFVVAQGVSSEGKAYPTLVFPALAAGMLATPRGVARFLQLLIQAYHYREDAEEEGGSGRKRGSGNSPSISHDTAVRMLYPRRQAIGSKQFMHANCGLGVFIAECGPNRIALHQAANEGYRGIYAVCFSGPDAGKGFVSVALGDDDAVVFNSAVGRAVFSSPESQMQGMDLSILPPLYANVTANASKETRVNQGYRHLLFNAFQNDDAPQACSCIEAQKKRGRWSHLDILGLSEQDIFQLSNQSLGSARNLVCPVDDCESRWATAWHNPCGFDYVVFAIRDWNSKVRQQQQQQSGSQSLFIDISAGADDAPEKVAIDLCWQNSVDLDADPVSLPWIELVPSSSFVGERARMYFEVESSSSSILPLKDKDESDRTLLVRVRIFPDGALHRVRMYLPSLLCSSQEEMDSFLSFWKSEKERDIVHSTTITATEDALDLDCKKLSDGNLFCWSSTILKVPRRRSSSSFTFRLANPAARIRWIELNMENFTFNNPECIQIEYLSSEWKVLVPSVYSKHFAGNRMVLHISEESAAAIISFIRVVCFPSGGFGGIAIVGEGKE